MFSWTRRIGEWLAHHVVDADPADRSKTLIKWIVILAVVIGLSWLVPHLLGL